MTRAADRKFPPIEKRPWPVAYTTREGDDWTPWGNDTRPRPEAHAIKFSDGAILDMVNGWRE